MSVSNITNDTEVESVSEAMSEKYVDEGYLWTTGMATSVDPRSMASWLIAQSCFSLSCEASEEFLLFVLDRDVIKPLVECAGA